MVLVNLRPWGDDDLDLLRAQNTPKMAAFVGGPEDEAAVYEMGWATVERAQGRGIATEAVSRCLGDATEHGTRDRSMSGSAH